MAIRSESAPVYAAVAQWAENCLVSGGSVFDRAALLWTPGSFARLNADFVENLLEDNRSFLDKLREQLGSSPPEVKQLAAEMLWLMMLFPSNMRFESKVELVGTVYGWSGEPLPPRHPDLDALRTGVGSTGQAYNQHRWRELAMLVRAMVAWSALPAEERVRLLHDGWLFAAFLDRIPDARNRQIRNILLHLLFPGQFERISSFGHKRRIVRHFAPMFGMAVPRESVTLPVDAFDRPLAEIRRALQERSPDRPIDFYDAEIEAQWRRPDGPVPGPGNPVALEKRLEPGLREVILGHFWLTLAIPELRARPTLGLLIAALMRSIGERRRDTAQALWQQIKPADLPADATDSKAVLALFQLPSGSVGGWVSQNVEADLGPILRSPQGEDVLLVLERADHCAREVSGQAAPEVSIRHLVGAILKPNAMNEAKRALEARGHRLDLLRVALMEFFQETLVADDLPAWRAYLEVPIPTPPLPRPGFARDYIDPHARDLDADHLQVDADVQALARLLCAESVQPPLSVGLFADWGTGKSTFMQRLKWNIGVLSDRAESARKRGVTTAYQGGVVHIWFNAWHYMDANLWASLVTHIFEQLARHLSGDPRDRALEETRKRLYARLAASQDLLAEAERRKALVKAEADAANERVAEAKLRQEGVARRIALARDVAAGMWKEIASEPKPASDGAKPADAGDAGAKQADSGDAGAPVNSAGSGAKPASSVDAATAGLVNAAGAGATAPVNSADAAKPGDGGAAGPVNSVDAGSKPANSMDAGGPVNSVDAEAEQKDAVDAEAAKRVDDALANIAKDVQRAVGTAARELGLKDSEASIAEIRGTMAQMRGLWGNVFASAEILHRRKGTLGDVLLLVLAAVVIAAVVVPLVIFNLEDVRAWVSAAMGLLIVLTPIISLLAASAAKVRRVLERADAEIQAATKRAAEEAEGLQRELDRLKQAEAQAERDRLQADQQVRQIESEIEDIRAGRRLEQFIRDRAGSDDYRRHLGIIATIRQDFEALEALLEEVRKESDAPPQPPEGAGAQPAAARPTPAVRRIILYIDDLDRCPEDRVVEVLQAVHLLLAFPLFVVVVGVDPRWLLRAVQSQYDRLLASDRETAQAGLPADDVLHWASTPQNYLEKIFQIPFTLEPMNEAGFGRLLGSLIKVRAPAAPSPPPGTPAPAPDPGPGDDEEGRDGLVGTQPIPLDEQWLDDDSPEEREHVPETDEDAGLDPPGLEVEEWELRYLSGLAPLIGSPRMAKRFANVYRFIRASLSGPRLDAFSGTREEPGEFRAVALLLALLTGFPGEAVELFRRLLADKPVADEGWPAFVRRVASQLAAEHRRADAAAAQQPPAPAQTGTTPPADAGTAAQPSAPGETLPARRWGRLRDALQQVETTVGVPLEMEPYREWAPRVARFSFQTGQILARRPTA